MSTGTQPQLRRNAEPPQVPENFCKDKTKLHEFLTAVKRLTSSRNAYVIRELHNFYDCKKLGIINHGSHLVGKGMFYLQTKVYPIESHTLLKVFI